MISFLIDKALYGGLTRYFGALIKMLLIFLATNLPRAHRQIQAKVHRHLRSLRAPMAPLVHPRERIGIWLSEVDLESMCALRSRLRAIGRATLTHLSTGLLRVLSRGACTSFRFHGDDRDAVFNAGGLMTCSTTNTVPP